MLVGSVINERFEILGLAGEGGMGSVYRARDGLSGEIVALKLLKPGSPHRARFLVEAETLARLDHPGIVQYLAHGSANAGGPAYLAMAWVEGSSLRERLLETRLSVSESVAVVGAAAAALASAHAVGIVHRDVKPENLMLVGGGCDEVKVLDFGVAFAAGPRARMTRTGTPLGTIGYMSPEQVRGETDVDARADVFALGAVFFEALTGQAPFFADHPLAVLAKITLEDAPRARDLELRVPKALDALVNAMLARERSARPKDASEVAARLRELERAPRAPSAIPSRRPPALTADERGLMCLVVADGNEGHQGRTLALAELEGARVERTQIAEAFAGRLEPLGPGSYVVVFDGRDPTATAERAARAALALRAATPEIGLALVAVTSSEAEHLPIARAVEGAMQLAQARGTAEILLDANMAGLVSASFVVREVDGTAVLEGPQPTLRFARRLLGKSTECVGRQRELEALAAIGEECFGDSVARVVLLTGPAGIGKSRILQEMTARSAHLAEQPALWFGRGDRVRAGTPFALLSDLLQRTFQLARPSADECRDALASSVCGRVPESDAPRVTEFLAEPLGLSFPEERSRELRAARVDPILMGDQIRRAFCDLLEHSARANPLLIVLDDLHIGDLPSVQAIDAALRRAAELPVMVLGVARPELHATFPQLWSERAVQEIRVGPLSRKAALALTELALGSTPEADRAALVERAQGNALFLEELIRAHAAGRAAAPMSVLSFVQARLAALDPAARRVLRAASVFGLHFWQGGVETLVGTLPVGRVDAWLSELSALELLTPRAETRFAGQQEYSFAHDLLREAAYTALTEDDKQLGHRLAAAWLERHNERDPRSLAEHHERGGSPKTAVPWWERAATLALEANDFDQTLTFVARGKHAGAGGALLGALLLTEAEAMRWTGELDRARSSLDAGLLLLPPGSPRWCHGVAEQALLCQRSGRADLLVPLGRSLLGRSVRDAPSDALAYGLVRVALFAWLSGHSALAEELAETAAHFEKTGVELEPATLGQAHVFRALSALYRGDLSTYLAEELAARAHFEEAGDARRALNESGSIGFAELELSAYRDAERTLVDALARAQQLGLEHLSAAAQHNLGLVYARLGRFEEARRVERASLEIFRHQLDRRLEGAALTYLAEIELLAGASAEAEQIARQALTLVREVAPPIVPLAQAILAQSRLAQGHAGEALTLASAARDRAIAGGAETGETLILATFADALAASGRSHESELAWTEARTRLLARAACIEDEPARSHFLEDIPENARTLRCGGL
ncbi:MAG: protein kinase [Myxococcales bacterium]|nr:protein kinase [Myxococcales bacterium]